MMFMYYEKTNVCFAAITLVSMVSVMSALLDLYGDRLFWYSMSLRVESPKTRSPYKIYLHTNPITFFNILLLNFNFSYMLF